MFECTVCNKCFNNLHKLNGHLSSHSRGIRYRSLRETEKSIEKRRKREIDKHKCKFCNKEFSTGQSLGGHIVSCLNNPKRNEWKLAIKTSNWMAEMSEEELLEFKSKHSNATSKGVRKKVLEGTWHWSFSKTRTHEYNGIKFYGKWELQYAQWLDKNSINWKRPKEKFLYNHNGVERYYTPDFYLIDEDCYIEVKGYETEKDRCKWRDFPFKLKILKRDKLYDLGIITLNQFNGKT